MLKSKALSSFGLVVFLTAALALAGCSSKTTSDQTASNESGGVLGKLLETSKPISVPEGTVVNVFLDQTLSSAQNRSGDEFDASVSSPVVVDGKTVIPKGARVRGRVVEANASGHLEHPASANAAVRKTANPKELSALLFNIPHLRFNPTC